MVKKKSGGIKTKSPLYLMKLALRARLHPLRQEMLEFMCKNGPKSVMELMFHFRLEQSVCSQHLIILLDSKLVSKKSHGKFNYYMATSENIKKLDDLAKQWID